MNSLLDTPCGSVGSVVFAFRHLVARLHKKNLLPDKPIQKKEKPQWQYKAKSTNW